MELTAVVRHTAFQIAAPRVGADIGGITVHVNELRFRVPHLALQRAFVAFQYGKPRLQPGEFGLPFEFTVSPSLDLGLLRFTFFDGAAQPFCVRTIERGFIGFRRCVSRRDGARGSQADAQRGDRVQASGCQTGEFILRQHDVISTA